MRLEDQLRRAIQRAGHAYNTEKSYVQYYLQFLQFIKSKYGQFRHPVELNKQDVEDFLTYLAADKNLAPDTQRVALSALKFLYQQVLKQDIGFLDFTMSTKPKKLPVVMTFEETAVMLDQFHGVKRLQSEIMYGCGLRISDCLRLRVKDLDFSGNTIQINDSKGCKNRLLMMPQAIKRVLQDHLDQIARFTMLIAAKMFRAFGCQRLLMRKPPLGVLLGDGLGFFRQANCPWIHVPPWSVAIT